MDVSLTREVLERVRHDTLLVSLMHVNNETGVSSPSTIAEPLARPDLLHVDAAQRFGKLYPADLRAD